MSGYAKTLQLHATKTDARKAHSSQQQNMSWDENKHSNSGAGAKGVSKAHTPHEPVEPTQRAPLAAIPLLQSATLGTDQGDGEDVLSTPEDQEDEEPPYQISSALTYDRWSQSSQSLDFDENVQSVAPRELQAVLISNTHSYIDQAGHAYTGYELHVPMVSGEHTSIRRYSDFRRLDRQLTRALGGCTLSCVNTRRLPALPPRTYFWQGKTQAETTRQRWGALQLYLDGVLDLVNLTDETSPAWLSFKQFLDLH
uniref:PX domain-containing protein n=1 Tax=Chrysotila carterae TaxID=13221 RepID=A0A7S4C1G5_CHRCT